MKNHASKIIALLMIGAASLARPVLAQTPVAAPVTPAALEIQISSSMRGAANVLQAEAAHPYLSLIFRNISTQPIQLFDEWNRWGFTDIHLEVIAIDGKTLPQPLVIKKVVQPSWILDDPSTETLAPNRSIVREIRLHVPTAVRYRGFPQTPNGIEEDDENFAVVMKNEYWHFPFAIYNKKIITMKAVYESPKENRRPDAWSGRIESPLLDYELRTGVEF